MTIKEYKDKWYFENKERISKKNKLDRISNPEKYKKQYQDNKDNRLEMTKVSSKKTRIKNKIKNSIKAKEYYKNNKDQVRNNQLKLNYGITLKDYNALLKNQNDCCAICNNHKSLFKKSLSVDHCHETGVVRKLLCKNCNIVLGIIKENVDVLSKMIDYIKKHNDDSYS